MYENDKDKIIVIEIMTGQKKICVTAVFCQKTGWLLVQKRHPHHSTIEYSVVVSHFGENCKASPIVLWDEDILQQEECGCNWNSIGPLLPKVKKNDK